MTVLALKYKIFQFYYRNEQLEIHLKHWTGDHKPTKYIYQISLVQSPYQRAYTNHPYEIQLLSYKTATSLYIYL